ncbi:MAG: toll/interleukin-1 receptor domain-containing protein [Chloroflexi bacterium]|nr:toll/interleukin-1 receptor domain-containing protein [Chloroflexota bacterium]
MAKQVFISHARNDREIADSLTSELRRRGFRVWEKKEVSRGQKWAPFIESALMESDLMVALLREHSYSSSYVRRELEHALFSEKYKNRLLPVFIASSRDSKFIQIPWVLESINHLRFDVSTPSRIIVEKIATEVAALLSKEQGSK